MLYVESKPGIFDPWQGERLPSGVLLAPESAEQLSETELVDLKLYLPAEAEPIPHGKVSNGIGVKRVNGTVRFVHALVSAPILTLSERRSTLLPRLAQKRWEVETGGIVAMGVPVRTDEVGQAKLTGALALFDNDPTLAAIDWEAQPGVWITLDPPTIEGLGVLVGRHVQACFSRARVVSEAIQAAVTHAAMDAAEAEIDQGWPV
jgi:hypothetical protein